jgi:MOSC domain-containing protein YiiM
MTGKVVSIYIADTGAAPMRAVGSVLAVAGKGLEGDRYFSRSGTFSDKPKPDSEITLIESEALEALERECGIVLAPGASRRNITTRGVSLNALVGQAFRVGEVTLQGLRLCEPCAHLARLTQPGVLRALVHRGGVRAQILHDGVIRVGDAVVVTRGDARA